MEIKWLFKPSFWFMNYPYDEDLDWWINNRLDNNPTLQFTGCDHTVRIDGVDVWVSNYPYAYGKLWGPRVDTRPSRRTIQRLARAVDSARKEQKDGTLTKIREWQRMKGGKQ